MKGSWKTTLWGAILAMTMGASQYGITVGKVGKGDYLGLAQVVSAAMLGLSSKDKDVTGGKRQNPNR